MRKRFSLVAALALALALLMPPVAIGQEERRFEAFGNFSYLFADVGGGDLGLADVGGIGFNGEFAFFLNDWLGLGVEVGHNTGDLDIPVIAIFPAPDIDFSQWTALFGPRFRFAESDRFRVGAQAMAGIARLSIDVDFDIDDFIIGVLGPQRFQLLTFDLNLDETAFAAAFGIHFDLKVHDRLTWRVVQPDVLVTSYGNDGQTHFRISSGLGLEF